MDLEQRLLLRHSRRHAELIAGWIGSDPRRFRALMQIFLHGEPPLAQRSAWVVSICADSRPALVGPYLRRMVDRMLEPGIHDAVRRAVVRTLQTVEIPPGLLGRVASVCFDQLADGNAPIAVRACAMTVVGRIAKGRPDLERELRLVVEQHLPFASAAFAARARRVLQSVETGEGAPPPQTGRQRGRNIGTEA